MIFSAKRRGDISETGAVLWLLKEGYEVFRNVSCVGPADLVVWLPGQAPFPIDVKTITKNMKTLPKLNELKQPGVRLLGYCAETNTARWSLAD